MSRWGVSCMTNKYRTYNEISGGICFGTVLADLFTGYNLSYFLVPLLLVHVFVANIILHKKGVL